MTNPGEDETLDELATIADDLLQQAAALRRRWAELGDALGVDLGLDDDAPAAPRALPAAAASGEGVSPVPAAGHSDNGAIETAPVAMRADFGEEEESDPVRVLAFDMMLSGRSRKEVLDFVRATYGQDADVSAVDELFDTR